MPHTFLEHSHYPRQRQDHLDVGIGFGGKPAELLHGALLVNLISFLHSDSPFSWKKNFPEAITPRGVRVATFYDLPGIPTLPNGSYEGKQTRRYGFIAYIGIQNSGLRKTQLTSWRLWVHNRLGKHHELKPINMPQ